MINHVVMWKFRQDLSQKERTDIASEMKEQMEAISQRLPNVQSLSVITDPLASSNCDILLLSVFPSEEALSAYQSAPEHMKLKARLMPFFASRSCIDY